LFGVKAVLGCHKNKERNPKICVANFFHWGSNIFYILAFLGTCTNC
jgi:hypothetical protein